MPPLPSDLRNKLERTIIQAREVAEAGARAALEGMAVHHHEPYTHQSPQERTLRKRLRAHAKQLGDTQDARGELGIDRLVRECAYEHWHRMLFSRFLAENDLLIEPSMGVAVSLDEAKELAKQAKVDLWTYASRCAQQMLPQIFRPDDPLLQVTLATEHRIKLEHLLEAVACDTFKADDSLGWVYQFWQSAEKERVNAAGDKITGDTLSAVTQLFTEHYMVLFLLHNTIGAWWAGKQLGKAEGGERRAESETELRKLVAVPGVEWEYLRFVQGAHGKGGPWRPAAGTFDGWPKAVRELKVLDPSCGSGHFLVAAFELLVRLRMAEEALDLAHAVDVVLADGLFGLELDARCTQIAAFNLALAAWKLAGYHKLPPLNIACSGIAPSSTLGEWLNLTRNGQPLPPLSLLPIQNGLQNLYELFQQAPTLGSLVNPNRLRADLVTADYETLQPFLSWALNSTSADDVIHERAVAAAGIARAAELLAGDYTLVITNVPYLGRGKQSDVLKDHLEEHYAEGKADLATAFVLRCLELCGKGSSTALVTPQNWLFLTTYTKLRERLLRDHTWNAVARLGSNAFQDMNWWAATTALLIVDCDRPTDTHQMMGIDVSTDKRQDAKAAFLRGQIPEPRRDLPEPQGDVLKMRRESPESVREPSAAGEEFPEPSVDKPLTGEIVIIAQSEQRKNPDAVVKLSMASTSGLLADSARTFQGISTGDASRYIARYWEVSAVRQPWSLYRMAPDAQSCIGCHSVLYWDAGIGELARSDRARICGQPAWGRQGITIGVNAALPRSLYWGELFDVTAATLVPLRHECFQAVAAYVLDASFPTKVREVDQALSVTEKSFGRVPFDLAHWQKVAAEKYPNGLPEPESDDPTQWLFHGRPEASTQTLQVGVARMLGYRWPAELDDKMRLSIRTRELVKQCDALLPLADDDGIVCIPSVRGEEPAAGQLLQILSSCGVKPDRDLDTWLRDDFFQQHCELFHHRPFVWHIWDGRKRDGFHALVNYHKLAEGDGKGRKLLESLTYSYLGDWINRQKAGVKDGEDGAEDRLAASLELQKRLVAILEGEPPFDLFIRWKKLSEQPIGWEPDINDGVRMNIRPFLSSDIPGGKKGAGILRWKPNIKWDKDRGKEPERRKAEFPWFWGYDGSTDFMGGSGFTGERFTDCHYSVQAKNVARQRVQSKEQHAR